MMRTLFSAALMATLVSGAGFAGPAHAADLDHYYVPREAPILRPAPPPCGVYRPCFRPYPRFGYARPLYRYGYVAPRYLPRPAVGYGEDRYGYDGPRRPNDRYGFDRPYIQPREAPRGERLDHYGDDEIRRGEERFDRGPDRYDRVGPDPYDRG